ncbi:MAG: type II and III secretion system protein, partial [Syntrophales bacterium LBB04]|nr:type II and III secretion system protein [Syntrophales bacterium LBB04]
VSAKGREVTWASLGVTIPEISKENIKTSIMVKDGDTVVLGGMMKQNDTYTNQKVPILHTIPVLGWLFKSKDKTVAKRNLLIFVTPNIIKKENAGTITQNKTDEYTKARESDEEPTAIYPVEK